MEDAEAHLDFLRRNQPLPTDDALTEEVIREFDSVRTYFQEHPDPRAVPLLLGAIPADGSSGFGVYQLLDDVLRVHDPSVVVEALLVMMEKPECRGWAMDFAQEYSDERLRRQALGFVGSSDADLAFWAKSYLELHG